MYINESCVSLSQVDVTTTDPIQLKLAMTVMLDLKTVLDEYKNYDLKAIFQQETPNFFCPFSPCFALAIPLWRVQLMQAISVESPPPFAVPVNRRIQPLHGQRR